MAPQQAAGQQAVNEHRSAAVTRHRGGRRRVGNAALHAPTSAARVNAGIGLARLAILAGAATLLGTTARTEHRGGAPEFDANGERLARLWRALPGSTLAMAAVHRHAAWCIKRTDAESVEVIKLTEGI